MERFRDVGRAERMCNKVFHTSEAERANVGQIKLITLK